MSVLTSADVNSLFEAQGNDLIIPDGVTEIGRFAFNNASDSAKASITSVVIPDSITSIGSFSFYGASNLKSVEIPNSVTSIGNYAFAGTQLTSVVISESTVIAVLENPGIWVE